MPDFRRRANRLAPQAYRGRRAYFLTLCTGDRRKHFASGGLVDASLAVLRTIRATYFFNVYAYCFVPDHFHLIVTGENDSADLSRFLQAFKSLAAREARELGVEKLWQKGFYDHVLRDGEALDAAAWYVFLNPVRARLARRAEDWPHRVHLCLLGRGFEVAVPFAPPWKSRKSE
jgi:putative transposase